MCGIAEAGVAMAGASMLFGAVGSARSTSANNAAAEYQARLSEREAQAHEQLRADAMARGKIDADTHRLKVGQVIGSQRASAGGSGFKADVGSALDVVADTASWGEMDALTIENNAAREAYSYGEAATSARLQADLARRSKRSVGTAVMGSILSGVGPLASSLYSLNAQNRSTGPRLNG
jgi:hypothetical protein